MTGHKEWQKYPVIARGRWQDDGPPAHYSDGPLPDPSSGPSFKQTYSGREGLSHHLYDYDDGPDVGRVP